MATCKKLPVKKYKNKPEYSGVQVEFGQMASVQSPVTIIKLDATKSDLVNYVLNYELIDLSDCRIKRSCFFLSLNKIQRFKAKYLNNE